MPSPPMSGRVSPLDEPLHEASGQDPHGRGLDDDGAQFDPRDSNYWQTLSFSPPMSFQNSGLLQPNTPSRNNEDLQANEATPALYGTDGRHVPASSRSFDASEEAPSMNKARGSHVEEHSAEYNRWHSKSRKSSNKTRNENDSRWRSHRYLNAWWWEMICCIIALGALLAIVATIRTHESQILPQWRYGLTVNAVIAIFTVVLKAAAGLVLAEGISHLKWISVAQPQILSTFVAHDDASRGPLGAMKLLFKNQYWSNGLHVTPFISSLGALITVFILLLDPFSQQIVRTYQCYEQTTGENGTIARTNIYKEVGLHSGAGEATIRRPVRDAVYNGIFSTQEPIADFTCRTGNCEFPETYTSLAYCSSCADVSSELEFEQYEEYDNFLNYTMPHTNVSLPVGRRYLTLSRGGQALSRGYVGLTSYFDYEAHMIRWDGRGSTPSANETIRAYRCNIYPCLRTYKGNISSGRLDEEIVNESGDVFTAVTAPGNGATVRSVADLNCLENQDQRQDLKQLGYQFNDTTRWLAYNGSLVNGTMANPVFGNSSYLGECVTSPPNQVTELCNVNQTTTKGREVVPPRCIYSIGHLTYGSLNENLFGPIFSGSVRNSWGYGYPGYDGHEAMTALWYAGSGNGTLEDVQGLMRSMTDTLTAYIRRAGEPGFSERVSGIMREQTTCIQVRWAWLAYAAMVVSLLLIFFTWMVVYARMSQSRLRKEWASGETVPLIHDFKSSASSVLLHGLDDETLRRMDNVGASNSEGGASRRAKEVTVRLVATDQGWKLSSIG